MVRDLLPYALVSCEALKLRLVDPSSSTSSRLCISGTLHRVELVVISTRGTSLSHFLQLCRWADCGPCLLCAYSNVV